MDTTAPMPMPQSYQLIAQAKFVAMRALPPGSLFRTQSGTLGFRAGYTAGNGMIDAYLLADGSMCGSKIRMPEYLVEPLSVVPMPSTEALADPAAEPITEAVHRLYRILMEAPVFGGRQDAQRIVRRLLPENAGSPLVDAEGRASAEAQVRDLLDLQGQYRTALDAAGFPGVTMLGAIQALVEQRNALRADKEAGADVHREVAKHCRTVEGLLASKAKELEEREGRLAEELHRTADQAADITRLEHELAAERRSVARMGDELKELYAVRERLERDNDTAAEMSEKQRQQCRSWEMRATTAELRLDQLRTAAVSAMVLADGVRHVMGGLVDD